MALAIIELFDSANNSVGTYATLKEAVDAATVGGETIRIGAGTVSAGAGQIVIDTNLTIEGAGLADTTV